MSETVVRPYEPRDQEQTWHVRAMTYNNGRPIPIEQQVYKTSTPFVAEVDGKILGTYVVMDMTCTRGDQAAWKTGGIAGVAVLPEARQSGVGGAMMRWSLRQMREEGYILAALYGFRETYYRKFDYEICGVRYKISCPTARLPRVKAELPISRVSLEDAGRIKKCYESFARARGGANLREDLHWGRVLNETRTIYAAGDPVEAYAILEHDVAFWEEQPIVEFAWTTARGYDSMLSFFGSVGINKSSLTWYEPSDSPLLARHLDEGIRLEPAKPVMYRLLNAPQAMEQMSCASAGEFSLSIQDPILPENDGPWHVSYGDGGTKVSACASAELALDARSAVQAFLGQPSLDDLVRNGVANKVAAAQQFFPPLPVYCMDFF